MSHPSQTGPIEKRWDYIKNYRYNAKFVDVYEREHAELVESHDHPSLTHPGFRFEIAYVLEGEAIAFTKTSRFPVIPGDCVMIDAPLSHGFELTSDTPLKLLNISFECSSIDNIAPRTNTLMEIAKHHSLVSDLTATKPIDDLLLHDDDGTIYAAIRMMQKELDEKLPGYQVIVKSKLAEIILFGLRKHFCKTSQPRYSAPVQKIVDYMEYGYMSNITLSNFSNKLGIPLRILSLQFKNEVGTTYTEYVHRKRITESCSLISKTNESIEFISDVVGYSSTKKFRKKFKEYVGMTPREYKKSLQEV